MGWWLITPSLLETSGWLEQIKHLTESQGNYLEGRDESEQTPIWIFQYIDGMGNQPLCFFQKNTPIGSYGTILIIYLYQFTLKIENQQLR